MARARRGESFSSISFMISNALSDLFTIKIKRHYMNRLKNELAGVFEGQMLGTLFSLGRDIVLVPIYLLEPVFRKVDGEVS